ncbi:phosphoribosylglycinamide formyltransferase [Campylobacter corcagiensis]|uniref:Phosphoribosylglycinamide formyltransferase n=1 Tax=Campylobacter corcagiensis TaxID=1448857 RepID=A0A7M1LHK8_9BACT|nr:phosphoribosylglycinamide formyltransferase [Campylobacter corcagiensis]QKF63985.1 phosphoribosylglycinamide formyltransferase 1 [Campylobacter corcagiensis]QOQ87811.1 phosphoribosylglycinamide formyltransferase [Campylobacter corcagiensis]
MVIKKIAVLFSGSGSNLEAILEKVHAKVFNGVLIEVALLITNKSDAFGIQRAKNFGLDTLVVNHKDFKSREDFDARLVKEITNANIDLTVLAGFMRILTPVFTDQILAINLHPSILPLFKGANAINDSYNSDMALGGVSVHYVSSELDAGKIIKQRAFEREKDMSLKEWEAKIHSIEHEILPEVIVEILTK